MRRKGHAATRLPGGHSEREPPDPIPNSEVKLLSADDSVGLSSCESRTLPGIYTKTPTRMTGRGFFMRLMNASLKTPKVQILDGREILC